MNTIEQILDTNYHNNLSANEKRKKSPKNFKG